MLAGNRPPLILASASPRRSDLLRRAGYVFDVVIGAVAESEHPELTLRELTRLNALRKCRAVSRLYPDAVVLAADTLVSFAGRAIGKPRDLDEARQILRRLSGQTHEVCTAVVVVHIARGRRSNFEVVSRVRFRRLSEEHIAVYLQRVDPLDKAGAYAAQTEGENVIERVEGSFTNVVGLPMEMTTRLLPDFGIVPTR